MTLINMGLSHRVAPAEVLEQLVVAPTHLDDVLARLQAVPAIDEVVVLSTCNRIEVYVGTAGPIDPVSRAVADVLAARGRISVGELLRMARIRIGAAAVEHLFSVACGLDSMAVGEDQILAQMKAAARAAANAGTSGPFLTGLLDAAFRVSKRARTETTISTAGISLARAGIDLGNAHLDGLAARHAVVVGTGAVGRLAARLLGRKLAEVELLRLHDRLPDLSEQQRAETAATVYRILRKFLHRPTVRAKQLATDPDGSIYLEALQHLFDVGASQSKE
jgi:glutamyl-tRNA reductase